MRNRLGISLFATAIAASAAVHAIVFATFSSIRVGPGVSPPEYAEMMLLSDLPAVQPPHEFNIGQPPEKGYATHPREGPHEQHAREAPQDQPSLSLDPVGLSRVIEVPSAPGDAAHHLPPADPSPPPALTPDAFAFAPVEPTLPRDLNLRLQQDRIDSIAPPPPADPPPADSVKTEIALAPLIPPSPRSPPSPPSPPSPAPREAAGSGADPAPESDSESDAFSVLGSARFRAGRVFVQSGRRVKTRRPKVGLAGVVELAQRSTAEVVLKVSVDETGKVTNVDVARSSGSNDIDQPCRVAMYDWWFEPKKDPAGRPVADVFEFTISFR